MKHQNNPPDPSLVVSPGDTIQVNPISSLKSFTESPIGSRLMDFAFDSIKQEMGLTDKKKEISKRSAFDRFMSSLADHWQIFFLVPLGLGLSLIILVVIWKLAMKLLGAI